MWWKGFTSSGMAHGIRIRGNSLIARQPSTSKVADKKVNKFSAFIFANVTQLLPSLACSVSHCLPPSQFVDKYTHVREIGNVHTRLASKFFTTSTSSLIIMMPLPTLLLLLLVAVVMAGLWFFKEKRVASKKKKEEKQRSLITTQKWWKLNKHKKNFCRSWYADLKATFSSEAWVMQRVNEGTLHDLIENSDQLLTTFSYLKACFVLKFSSSSLPLNFHVQNCSCLSTAQKLWSL